jgi:hypothetical protein
MKLCVCRKEEKREEREGAGAPYEDEFEAARRKSPTIANLALGAR